MEHLMDEFMKDFTPKERAKVRARTAELIERELMLRVEQREWPHNVTRLTRLLHKLVSPASASSRRLPRHSDTANA